MYYEKYATDIRGDSYMLVLTMNQNLFQEYCVVKCDAG
jgi:hypothetical protein